MTKFSGFLNDSSRNALKFRVYLNLDTFLNLRSDSAWPDLEGLARYRLLLANGFEGLQLTNDSAALTDAPLPHCGLDRINTPADADGVAAKHAMRRDNCITVHAGWGIEDEADTFRLVEESDCYVQALLLKDLARAYSVEVECSSSRRATK